MGGPKIITRITNDAGRSFNVLLVARGDRYGLGDKLTHDKDDPLVEFWDATYENDERFSLGRGQFVTRYCLSTLTDRNGRSVWRATNGLDLCGHEPAWKISAKNVAEVLKAIETWQRVERKFPSREDNERKLFGCTAEAIDEALAGKEPRDIAMYAMGTLSNAQELIRRIEGGWTISDRDAATIRQFINIAKYAIDKAVPR